MILITIFIGVAFVRALFLAVQNRDIKAQTTLLSVAAIFGALVYLIDCQHQAERNATRQSVVQDMGLTGKRLTREQEADVEAQVGSAEDESNARDEYR